MTDFCFPAAVLEELALEPGALLGASPELDRVTTYHRLPEHPIAFFRYRLRPMVFYVHMAALAVYGHHTAGRSLSSDRKLLRRWLGTVMDHIVSRRAVPRALV